MNELGNTPADKNYKPSGISRAEERALEAYPEKWTWGLGGRESFKYDQNAVYRGVFKNGYRKAEKDLALTWEDMELLHRLFAEEEDNFSKHDKYFYTEVLKRFKEAKQ